MDENFDIKKHLPIIGILVLIVVVVLASRKGGGGASIASYNQALQAGAQADNELARIDAGRTVEMARIKDSAFGKLLQFKLARETVEAGERTAFMEATTGREIAFNTNQLTATLEAAKLSTAERLGFAAITSQRDVELSRGASSVRVEEVRAALERERAALTSGATVAAAQAAAGAQAAAAQAAAGAQRAAAGSQTTSTLINAIASVGNRILDRVLTR